ncbi:PaaI family thioesterase [Spiribacter halobius]|uniref:Thioesterase n=1 Tax=Sediminicurvatus halobius TaxID=2182432 RepID=A0A2U2MXS7_9GAMM|nr:PaaI family thioesterase [Spiribacter halobius]PWG61582.1 thioesterase [Spiribacter halobius]UEX77152.1 PaaI family thioesterase [Spiribacter halobius]
MSELPALIAEARADGDPQRLVAAVPYAGLLGVAFESAALPPVFRLDHRDSNIGNPQPPALHGGVIGAFMEHAAIFHLLWVQGGERLPRVVDIAIDYLRPGQPQATYARCDVRRQGRRVANVGIEAWQISPDGGERVIATARAHFLLAEPG